MIPRRYHLKTLCALLLLGISAGAACHRKKPIVVSSKPSPQQTLLGEIVAQHLENRLDGIRIDRRPGTGGTPILYQAIAGGEITIYPETTGFIATGILKEQPSKDPAVLLERDRMEIARIAQLDLIDLGYEDGPAVVIRPSEGDETTLSEAALGKSRWKLAITPDFEQSADFLGLNTYHLPLAAPLRTSESSELFDGMTQGAVNMVVTTITDWHLTSPDWRVLSDDNKAFAPQEICLMVRQDRLKDEPRLRPALLELVGKLNVATVRKLNQELDIAHGDVAAVARQFLASVGLH